MSALPVTDAAAVVAESKPEPFDLPAAVAARVAEQAAAEKSPTEQPAIAGARALTGEDELIFLPRLDPARDRLDSVAWVVEHRDELTDEYRKLIGDAADQTSIAFQRARQIDADPDLSLAGREKKKIDLAKDRLRALAAVAERVEKFEQQKVESVFREPIKAVSDYDPARPWTWAFDLELARQFAGMSTTYCSHAVAAIAAGKRGELRDALLRVPRTLSGVTDAAIAHVKAAAISHFGGEPMMHRRAVLTAARDATWAYLQKAVAHTARLSPVAFGVAEKVKLLGGRRSLVR